MEESRLAVQFVGGVDVFGVCGEWMRGLLDSSE